MSIDLQISAFSPPCRQSLSSRTFCTILIEYRICANDVRISDPAFPTTSERGSLA